MNKKLAIIALIIAVLSAAVLSGCRQKAEAPLPTEVPAAPAPTAEPTPEPTPEPTAPIALNADGSFEMYGRQFNINDEQINLSHVKVDDNGALVASMIPFMKNLRFVDMDSCGVDDEHMAAIRDVNPAVEVVWRIWFGNNKYYSVRTNVERILASNPGFQGEWELLEENTSGLKYCTKVKYLDIGHNDNLRDLSFINYMPNLEILICAMGQWSDISCLANCPKLEYAELQTSCLNDLSPLANCKNLKHLNICHCFALWDITPLYELPQLERLWIGKFTPIAPEQIEQFRKIAPNCVVNTDTVDPTEFGWRYISTDPVTGGGIADPYYAHVREVFEYGSAPYCYSYAVNDPLL